MNESYDAVQLHTIPKKTNMMLWASNYAQDQEREQNSLMNVEGVLLLSI